MWTRLRIALVSYSFPCCRCSLCLVSAELISFPDLSLSLISLALSPFLISADFGDRLRSALYFVGFNAMDGRSFDLHLSLEDIRVKYVSTIIASRYPLQKESLQCPLQKFLLRLPRCEFIRSGHRGVPTAAGAALSKRLSPRAFRSCIIRTVFKVKNCLSACQMC